LAASSTLSAIVGFAAAALLAAPVCAQAPIEEASASADSRTEAPDVGDEVVVRGRRMSEIEAGLRIEIGKFIEEIAAPPAGRGYARWQRRVCVGVHNIERTAAQYLVDRVSRLAADVGLEPGEPGCQPEVIIIFTTDGKQTASFIAQNQTLLLRPSGEGGMHRGLEALREFAESERPVRWWHVSMPVDARHGTPAIHLPQHNSQPPDQQHPTINVAGPSRIHSGIRDDLRLVVIIVDGAKLKGQGTTWEQLGDYLAFVSLAQVDLGADPAAFDSILNLFSNPGAYSGLTDWDQSYIRALYAYDQERNPRRQRNELVSQMIRREIAGDE
jgi:hypothetical protein